MYTYMCIYIYIYIWTTCPGSPSEGSRRCPARPPVAIAVLTKIDVASTHGSFPIGLISDWARFQLGSILTAFLPNDLPN